MLRTLHVGKLRRSRPKPFLAKLYKDLYVFAKIDTARFHIFSHVQRPTSQHAKIYVLALEVLQKHVLAFPRSVGSIIFFASHAAWRFDFSLFRPLQAKTHDFDSRPYSRRRAPAGLVAGRALSVGWLDRRWNQEIFFRIGTSSRHPWPRAVYGRVRPERFVYLTSWDLGRVGSLRAAALRAHASARYGGRVGNSSLHYMSNSDAALIAAPTFI